MLIIIVFFSISILILYRLLSYFKLNTGIMEGMVITMAISMAIGLLIGNIVGIYLSGQLLISTLVSVGISSLIGFAIGILFSFHASFEGLFSGLMSAMMAAMIVEMIPNNQQFIFLYISSMFLIVTAVCCFILLLSNQHLHGKMSKVYLIGIIWVIATFIVLVSNTTTSFQHINFDQNHTFYRHLIVLL
ncbi:hypothetical protein ACM26V_06425 [Salipaludibacillus sp. HK11]|uniref:hypothetical protein n=1 Tax=Salipaludibacillus sp. HK11 TaxID=3394320 RepID=UPI0039FD9F4E